MTLAPPSAIPDARDAVTITARSVHGFVESALQQLPEFIAGVVVFVVFIGLAHGCRWLVLRATRKGHRVNVGMVVGRLTYFGLLLLGALIALTVVIPSMTPAKLVSLLGLGGVALGFAFKDIFQNLVAGILLLWREPFRIGDEITSLSYTGVVETIDTRATLIRTYDGQRVIVPNSQIYTQSVSVITAYPKIRSSYDIGIGYGDDIAKAKGILLDILTSTEGILDDPAPDVIVWDLAGSTVNLRARWWSKPERAHVVAARDRVLHQVRDRMTAAGIDLPFPTSVVLLHDQTEEVDGDRARQREGWPVPTSGAAPAPARQARAEGSANGKRTAKHEPAPGALSTDTAP